MSQEGKKPPLDAIPPIEIELSPLVESNHDDDKTDPGILAPPKVISGTSGTDTPTPGLELALALEPTSNTPRPISAVPNISISPGINISPKSGTNTGIKMGSGSIPAPALASAPKLAIAQPLQTPPETVSPLAPRMPEMGPLESLMKDPAITEIMVNDLRNVMVEREGRMMFSGFTFKSIDDLNRLVRSMLDATGRVLGPDSPYVDLSLSDGSRVNVVGPPLTLNGPCITIRKFPRRRPSIDDLMNNGSLDRRIAYFLNVCVMGRRNILISGGTDTGKTTLLNALAQFIPKPERIVSIEDSVELAINHPNSVRLQTKPISPSSPPINARELVANALRMRPDRIIVGECRKGEAFDMLQAINTGHLGSM
ncbi:MAG: ATPase, T2SS/T4P/T4SS family, partial [Bdellovibrionota bacterium]